MIVPHQTAVTAMDWNCWNNNRRSPDELAETILTEQK
jgi:hypothetical protein